MIPRHVYCNVSAVIYGLMKQCAISINKEFHLRDAYTISQICRLRSSEKRSRTKRMWNERCNDIRSTEESRTRDYYENKILLIVESAELRARITRLKINSSSKQVKWSNRFTSLSLSKSITFNSYIYKDTKQTSVEFDWAARRTRNAHGNNPERDIYKRKEKKNNNERSFFVHA